MKQTEIINLNAKNTLRAQKFYNNVFKTNDNVGINIQTAETTNQHDQLAVEIIDVPDIDFLLHNVKSNGGSISVPKIHIPSVGYLAYFIDTEGNIIGVVEKEHQN